MNEKIERLLAQGEGLSVEFKECANVVSGAVYETVCAFLNTKGGDIFLGVRDDGKVIGISKENIDSIKKDFVYSVNNPSKLSPACCLSVVEIPVNGNIILHIFVPESSQVHRCNTKIFISCNDGDFDITDRHQEVSNLYIKKRSSYSENKIFHAATLEDLRVDLIAKARKLAGIQDADHQWRQTTRPSTSL